MARGEQPTTRIRDWLCQRFDLEHVRDGQAAVLEALESGRRVLFVAPTGHGKSLCYQGLAALPRPSGVVLVFQPLKALMAEQVERARKLNLRAALINSDQGSDQQEEVLRAAENDDLDLLFLAPERQGNALWQAYVPRMAIKGVVIDEAHCISQWGHDFRPWYMRLVRTVMGLGIRTPVLALTATAPGRVVEDIRGQIAPGDEGVRVVRLSSHRPNIVFACRAVDGLAERLAALESVARKHEGRPGLAYVLTRFEAEVAAGFLRSRGIPAREYHAGFGADERRHILDAWQRDDVRVVCATSALGMGMDRADVRWVVHLALPDSLIRYVQEIGRVGRDGKPAHAYAIHDASVADIYESFIFSSHPPPGDFVDVARVLRSHDGIKRTAIIEAIDLPEQTTQRVLDELVEQRLCARDGSPYAYHWIGGQQSPIPDGLEDAVDVRQRMLAAAMAYAGGRDCCRSVSLARAMGDDPPPAECGACDICTGSLDAAATDDVSAAKEFLARYTPPIKADRSGGALHEAGVALSIYGLGTLGELVKASKYSAAPAPSALVDRALQALTADGGAYDGARFDAVVYVPSSTSGGDFVRGFAEEVARRLGVRSIELERTRESAPQKRYRSQLLKRRNVQDLYRLPEGTSVLDEVLLLDDIWDSGQTIKAAARALRPATVYPLVMARTKHADDR